MPSWRKNKSGPKKRFIFKTHKNCVDSKPSRTHVRSWKHQLLLLCPVKLWRIVGVVYPTTFKTKLACILEAQWIHQNAYGEFWTSQSRRPYCRKRWKFITALQFGSQIYSNASSCENSGSKSSSGQGMGKIGENFGVDLDESKKQVVDEARTSGTTVHVASLMDMCHLKNAELEEKHQKYKCWVVLRGDIVKDDSESYAVFTEQGSSASQNDSG